MTLYTQPECCQCKMVHTLLDKKKVQYTECQDKELMKKLGIDHTPTLEVDGKFLKAKEMLSYINGI